MRGDTAEVDGEAVKRFRGQKGWTQKELAGRVGCDRRVVQRLEAGERTKLTTIEEFAEALGVKAEEIKKRVVSAEGELSSRPPEGTDHIKATFEIVTSENTSKAEISIPIDKEKTSHILNALIALMQTIAGSVAIVVIYNCVMDIEKMFNGDFGPMPRGVGDWVADQIRKYIYTSVPIDVIIIWVMASILYWFALYWYLTYKIDYEKYYKAWVNKRRA